MLYIIYCKPDKKQGKKEFIKLLKKEFGVEAIAKYTNKRKPTLQNEVDENLIYINTEDGEISSRDDFLSAVNKQSGKSFTKDTFYIYERKKERYTYYYGISQEDIWQSLDSQNNYALVCTNIDIIKRIKDDAKAVDKFFDEEYRQKILAYCLVRQEKEEEGNTKKHISNKGLTIKELKDLYNNSVGKIMPDWLKDADEDDTQTIILPYGEARELDFFRYLIEFSNLLIIKSYSNFDADKHKYVEDVCELVEKYIGLKRIRKNSKNVFIIHPMSRLKFSLISDNTNVEELADSNVDELFRKFICKVFEKETTNGSLKLVFASDIQKKIKGSDNLIPPILNAIKHADIIIGDFRNVNHNCIYETGYAYALKELYDKDRIVYFIAPEQHQKLIEYLQFDVKTYNFIYYNIAKMKGSSMNTISQLEEFREKFQLEYVEYKTEDVIDLINQETK